MTTDPRSVKIRKVKHTVPKIAAVRFLDRLCFQEDSPFPIYDNTLLWVGEVDKMPVCFSGMTHIEGTMGFLSRAGVLPQYSGRGLHRRMINLRIRAARKLGWTSLVTYTHRMNAKSINNLIQCGFLAYEPASQWGHDEALYLWRKI